MSNLQNLWIGTVNVQYRKRIIKLLLYSAIIIDIFPSLGILSAIQSSELFWLVVSYILLTVFIFFNALFFGGILFTWFRKGPEFMVTATDLILRERNFWGRFHPTKSMSLEKIEFFHIQERNQLDKFKNDFLFFSKSLEKFFEEWPDLEKESPEYVFSEIPSDFRFYAVDTPVKLLTILQSLIPLKKHPTLNETYQRIG